MRMGSIFSTTSAVFFVLFFLVGAITRQYLCDFFMFGQLLIARQVISIVLGKAAIFHPGLEWS